MKQRSRANALLIELVLVIFFFMLGSTVLVRLFADARHRTIQARATNVSIAAAQNIAEELYGAEDPEGWLAANGFVPAEDAEKTWTLAEKEYTLYVTETSEEKKGGKLRTFTISSVGEGKQLFTLPSTRYLPKEVSP
jgi:hypothetical protein